ncbi:hypothetical protein GCM10017771_66660 [Streptomyces capitiformicae]|uniref:Aminotransferase class I/classII large domain-containing protein n=1 Tax=Streptomyces capitiformicae TaxID=2014920 RepID=A0A918ZEY0_9ACTN|nr:hypothetical protein GCM10017771_66660 [Streptomyces capitiformicae]
MTAAPELVAAVRSAKQFLTYVASGPFQHAVAEALHLPDSYFAEFRADMLLKRELLADGLEEAGFEVFRPAGTYFITTDIRLLGESDGFAFCRALPKRCGVVAIPNAVFHDHRDRARPSCASRSASGRACWRRPCPASSAWPAEALRAGETATARPRTTVSGDPCTDRAVVRLRTPLAVTPRPFRLDHAADSGPGNARLRR